MPVEDGLRIAGIVLAVVCLGSIVVSAIYKQLAFAKYQELFVRQDYEGCLRLLNKPLARLALPGYNRLFMMLNAELCLDDAPAAESTIDQMLKMRATHDQRLALLARSFDFFIDQKNYKRAKKVLVELREKVDAEKLKSVERTYDIFAHGSSAYIQEVREELESASPSERLSLLYLLSVQYENSGDTKRSEECLAQIKEALESERGV